MTYNNAIVNIKYYLSKEFAVSSIYEVADILRAKYISLPTMVEKIAFTAVVCECLFEVDPDDIVVSIKLHSTKYIINLIKKYKKKIRKKEKLIGVACYTLESENNSIIQFRWL